jgi:hypothetical protein
MCNVDVLILITADEISFKLETKAGLNVINLTEVDFFNMKVPLPNLNIYKYICIV